jgi:electron transport complex protein RnfG
MSKKESTFMNMTITLLVITLIAGVSLGFINDLTVGPKAEAKLEQKIRACQNLTTILLLM